MGSRERRRTERNKRKRRSAEREAEAPTPEPEREREPEPEPEPNGDKANGGDAFAAVQGENAPPEETFQERVSKRSEARNAEVRAGLEPLADGERPGAVTVAAIVSGVGTAVFALSAFVALFGLIEIDGEEPAAAPLFLVTGGFALMTYGLIKARYWAVLGFQTLMLIAILASALGLVQVVTVAQVIGSLLLLGGSGTLFYFMIRAMARIQMPDRSGERDL